MSKSVKSRKVFIRVSGDGEETCRKVLNVEKYLFVYLGMEKKHVEKCQI